MLPGSFPGSCDSDGGDSAKASAATTSQARPSKLTLLLANEVHNADKDWKPKLALLKLTLLMRSQTQHAKVKSFMPKVGVLQHVLEECVDSRISKDQDPTCCLRSEVFLLQFL